MSTLNGNKIINKKELLLPLDSAKQSRDVTNKIIQLNYKTIFKMAPLRK